MRLQPRHLLILATIALVVLPSLVLPSAYHFRVGALVFIAAIVVVGLNLLMGFAGQVSLGHAGFFAIGAYAAAILPVRAGFDPILAGLTGVLAAGLLAWLIGRPVLKLRGYYLAVATLALGLLVALVLNNEVWLTGGPDGMPVERATFFGTRLRTPQTWYWITGGMLILAVAIAANLIDSPTGRAWRALHDSAVAAEVLGIDAPRYKLAAFVISAVYAAAAGAAQALFNGLVTPDAANFLHSVEYVTMAVIGGMGSILGSIVGAALLVILPQALAFVHEYETLLVGLIIILFMIFLREGIVPTLQALIARRRA